MKRLFAVVASLTVQTALAAEGPTATLHVERVNAPSATLVYFADGRDCTGRETLGAAASLAEREPLAIGAGREIALWLRQERDRQAFGSLNLADVCEVMVSFTPVAGSSYRLVYRVSPDGRQCGVAVSRLDAGRVVPEQTAKIRAPLNPADESRPACGPSR